MILKITRSNSEIRSSANLGQLSVKEKFLNFNDINFMFDTIMADNKIPMPVIAIGLVVISWIFGAFSTEIKGKALTKMPLEGTGRP